MFWNIKAILGEHKVNIDDENVKRHLNFKFVEQSNNYTPDGKVLNENKEYKAKQCEVEDFGPYTNKT